MPIHPRHPYVGELVYTAFSGTHQDAIRKGFAVQGPGAWEVPYLPIDPADVGRGYEAVVRVNSQSGKGGIAHVLESVYGVQLSVADQVVLARRVQRHTEATGREASAAELKALYEEEVHGCSN
jgi:2-isopropylmalate synthase